MRKIAIANHKGGVGKTATAQALGVVLAERFRVLLVDTDPQASLTMACGVGDAEGESLAEVLGGASEGILRLRDVLRELRPGLDLAPADIALAASELGLTARMGREHVLRDALRAAAGNYDLALIDCPPSLGMLTVNALVAADAVLIPTQPQGADLRGLQLFLDTLQRIRRALNPKLETLGVLVTFHDRRLIHHREAIEAMQRAGIPLLEAIIGRSVRVAEGMAAGAPVTDYEPGNPQAEAYRELAREVGRWLKSAA